MVFCPDQMILALEAGTISHLSGCSLWLMRAGIFRQLGYLCSLYSLVWQKSKETFLPLDTIVPSYFRFGWWVLPTLEQSQQDSGCCATTPALSCQLAVKMRVSYIRIFVVVNHRTLSSAKTESWPSPTCSLCFDSFPQSRASLYDSLDNFLCCGTRPVHYPAVHPGKGQTFLHDWSLHAGLLWVLHLHTLPWLRVCPTASVNTSSHIWSPGEVVSWLNVSSAPIFVTKQSTGEFESVGLGFFLLYIMKVFPDFHYEIPVGFAKYLWKTTKRIQVFCGSRGINS